MDYKNMETSIEEKGTSGLAIASMVLGIVSLCISCIPIISIICSILGLVFGCISLRGNKSGRGMAIAGIITSIVSIILMIIFLIIYINADVTSETYWYDTSKYY